MLHSKIFLPFIILFTLSAENAHAAVPSESEFLNNTSAPVVESFTGTIAGQNSSGMELTSFGLYWVDSQSVASVWRIRNSLDNAQIVQLTADTLEWQTTLSVPANSQIYVSSPNLLANHILILDGTHISNTPLESQIVYTLPQADAISQTGHALLTHDLSDGGLGGAHISQAWVQRELNSEIYDTADFVNLYNNKFTLKPGTYLIEANQTFFGHASIRKNFKGRIRNISNNTTVAVGLNSRQHIALGESTTVESEIPKTHFTIDTEQTFELQFFAENADAEFGLGYRVLSGELERYAYVYIAKLK